MIRSFFHRYHDRLIDRLGWANWLNATLCICDGETRFGAAKTRRDASLPLFAATAERRQNSREQISNSGKLAQWFSTSAMPLCNNETTCLFHPVIAF